ncbi:MAG: DUF4388 domain-containing protein [bacterium]|nr:DUF4388 domain-containing protein [bacterium]
MIQGDLDQLHLGDLLQWLQMGELSGRLTLSSQGHDRCYDLLEGRIVYVSSTVPKERFGAWLAREGLLSPTELRLLLGVSLLRRTLFTDGLLSSSGLDRENLCASLGRLAETITARLMLADQVTFSFDPAFPTRDLLNLDLDVQPNQLLLEAARKSDEDEDPPMSVEHDTLPLSGDAFETFFCEVLKNGVDRDNPLDGEGIARVHQLLRDISQTVSQWLVSSPGLVPIPDTQAERMSSSIEEGNDFDLDGNPHITWNQMVLACSLFAEELANPSTLTELGQVAKEMNLWAELGANTSWRRPSVPRLDELTSRAVASWSRAASVAAPFLDVDPGLAHLAAHLVVIPTDLVLWVLATLPIRHEGVRRVLLSELPRRIGATLAHRANFPHAVTAVIKGGTPTHLGGCLQLSRSSVPSESLWHRPVPGDEKSLLTLFDESQLVSAKQAVEATQAD